MNIVAKFGDHLETRGSVPEMELALTGFLPERPDEVVEEDDDCETVREFDAVVGADGKVTLIPF